MPIVSDWWEDTFTWPSKATVEKPASTHTRQKAAISVWKPGPCSLGLVQAKPEREHEVGLQQVSGGFPNSHVPTEKTWWLRT